MPENPSSYLLAAQPTELERLQIQSKVWEPAGRALLAELPTGPQRRALDVGCGVYGWLRLLSDWVGPSGSVVGSDIDDKMLSWADQFISSEQLSNVTLVKDDLFRSQLTEGSFDLVHARFQIAPLGRAAEQLTAYRRLLRPGGVLVLEDPDMGSWRFHPEAPALQELIALSERGFLAAGGNFNSGRNLPALLREAGMRPRVTAQIVALEPGHPYLRLPLQFAASFRTRLESLVPALRLKALLTRAESELSRPGVWGTTFTLIQAYATAGEYVAPAEG